MPDSDSKSRTSSLFADVPLRKARLGVITPDPAELKGHPDFRGSALEAYYANKKPGIVTRYHRAFITWLRDVLMSLGDNLKL